MNLKPKTEKAEEKRVAAEAVEGAVPPTPLLDHETRIAVLEKALAILSDRLTALQALPDAFDARLGALEKLVRLQATEIVKRAEDLAKEKKVK